MIGLVVQWWQGGPKRVAPLEREAVKVDGKDEIGIEIEYLSQLALHVHFRENQRLIFLIIKINLSVFEIDKRGGVGAVIYRSCRLYLQVTAQFVVFNLFNCEKQLALNLLVGRKLGVGKLGGVHVIIDSTL